MSALVAVFDRRGVQLGTCLYRGLWEFGPEGFTPVERVEMTVRRGGVASRFEVRYPGSLRTAIGGPLESEVKVSRGDSFTFPLGSVYLMPRPRSA